MPRIKTIGDLESELRAKRKSLSVLARRRQGLLAKLNAVDRQIASLAGGSARGRAGGAGKRVGRRRSGKSLVSYLQRLLKKVGKGMRAKDIAQAVVKAGYHSTSKNFYPIVAAALRDKKLFRRVRRGVYTVK
ncbi:MAG TPA: hypothetical protein VNA25_28410 [Phycisphaerae bacterium]|nr:hypothetical protein [Phycisphaerae bacterium]